MLELARLDRLLIAHADRLARRPGRSSLLGDRLLAAPEALALLEELATEHAAVPPTLAHQWRPELPSLVAMAEALGLDELDTKMISIAIAPELDARYARVFAYLANDRSKTRPTVGLALAVFGGALANLDRLLPDRPLRRFALVELDGEEALASQRLRVPIEVWPRLVGMSETSPFLLHAARPGALDALALPPGLRADARRAARWLARRACDAGVLVVRGRSGSGRTALARAVVAEAGLACLEAPLEADPRSLLREARWNRAVVEVGEIASFDLDAPLVTCRDHAVATDGRPSYELRVPDLDVESRAAIWRSLLSQPGIDTRALARRFRFPPRQIAEVTRIARERSDAMSSDRASAIDRSSTTEIVAELCRDLPRSRFGALAEQLACDVEADDLVLRPASRRELALAARWSEFALDRLSIVQRRRLALRGGPACLFHGPPGTGKTMAARIVARQLGLDLYRVDLSQVVNKYIGETEKHLATLFREAEAANVILFFDEADALFAKRTDVRDGHDRYANIETGFLLQRLENHTSPAILATNLAKNLDDAFLRRFHIVIEFVLPDAAERAQIWERLLPSDCGPLDFDLLAAFPLAGADIRNAIITGTVLAGTKPVAMDDLAVGVFRELRKAGRLVEPTHFGAWAEAVKAHARPTSNSPTLDAPPRR